MKVDFSTVLHDLDDKPIQTTDKDPTPATLGAVARMALQFDDQRNPDPPDKKLRVFDLMLHIRAGGVIELTPEQATLIKEKVGAAYGALIYGRCNTILNG